WKFFLVLGVVVPSIVAVSWVGDRALASMKQRLDTVYSDTLSSARTVGQLATSIEEAEEMSRLLVAQTHPPAIQATTAELRNEIVPDVQQQIDQLHDLAASGTQAGDVALAEQLQGDWRRFLGFTETPTFLAAASGLS